MSSELARNKAEALLTRLEQVEAQLAEAQDFDDFRAIFNGAAALARLLRCRNSNHVIRNRAARLKIWAEWEMGSLLQKSIQRGRPEKGNIVLPFSLPEGVSKMQSHRWQRIASVPRNTVASHIEAVAEVQGELTESGVLRLAKKPSRPLKPTRHSRHFCH